MKPVRYLILQAVLIACGVAMAQSATGGLAGTVADATGARVPAAHIVLHASAVGLERRLQANARGEFRLSQLPPGAYELSVSAPGFATASANITVQVSTVRSVHVTLRPAAAHTTVNVSASASSITTASIDLTSAAHQGVVTAHDLATLPMAQRSFANIAYLVPGTEPVEPSDPTKARITAVSTGGSSGLNNSLTVDGAANSDDYIGGFLQNLPVDALQEFAFQSAGQNASVGGTTAGAVEITTKRGTDEWHGSAAVLERAAALNARFPIDNPAPNPKQPFSRQDYSASLGGPIARGKLWFFSALEYVPEQASIAYSPANQIQFQALAQLANDGLIPGVRSIPTPSSVSVPFHDFMADERLDWAQSSNSHWFLRLSADNYTTDNAFVQQGSLPSTGTTWHANYLNGVVSNTYTFSPNWVGSLAMAASYLHMTQLRNQHLGFALAFPFTSTSSTISGFETFGDNQFLTPITAFPVLRNQENYQFSYDMSHNRGAHATRFGVNFVHEPVLSGALSGTAETLTVFPMNPGAYVADPAQFAADLNCAPNASPGATCTATPAGNGSFSQNVQRLGLYGQDAWKLTPDLTLDYGLRYDTTFGLFLASGRTQADNPAYLTLKALQIPLVPGVPHDDHSHFAPRLGLIYAPGAQHRLVIRSGFGLYYDDLAQNGWVTAMQAVNSAPAPCVAASDPGCLPGAASGGSGALIDPNYKTPYALDATGGAAYALTPNWNLSADFTHEEGNHGYRAYNYNAGYTLFSPRFARTMAAQQANVPDITVFRSDNRSRYDALMLHLQGNLSRRLHFIANYTLSRANTWGCVLGELFDYVDGVCNPLNAFGPGDFGPSGEDVTHRLVLAGDTFAPGGFQLSALLQAESGRPLTLTTPVDVNGAGDAANDRAVINGVPTALDEFRGTPYIQLDLRLSRPFTLGERWHVYPSLDMFNVFNRNNPGSNYITNIAALPTPVNNLFNATALCQNAACTEAQPITSPKQLLAPAGALGDFFGPGTTVGIPFAAQLGLRISF